MQFIERIGYDIEGVCTAYSHEPQFSGQSMQTPTGVGPLRALRGIWSGTRAAMEVHWEQLAIPPMVTVQELYSQ